MKKILLVITFVLSLFVGGQIIKDEEDTVLLKSTPFEGTTTVIEVPLFNLDQICRYRVTEYNSTFISDEFAEYGTFHYVLDKIMPICLDELSSIEPTESELKKYESCLNSVKEEFINYHKSSYFILYTNHPLRDIFTGNSDLYEEKKVNFPTEVYKNTAKIEYFYALSPKRLKVFNSDYCHFVPIYGGDGLVYKPDINMLHDYFLETFGKSYYISARNTKELGFLVEAIEVFGNRDTMTVEEFETGCADLILKQAF